MLDFGFEKFLNAIKHNDIRGVECLIETRFDPNSVFEETGFSPLHLAAWYDKPHIIKLLRRRGAKVDKSELTTKKTALHIAAYFGHLDSCKALIQENPSVNSEDEVFFIPLHYAALRGHLDVVQLLSDNIKDLWANSVCGSPLDVAIRHQNIDIIDYFLAKLEKHFAPLFGKSKRFSFSAYLKKSFSPVLSQNPLYFATILGAKDIVQLLLAKKYFRYTEETREHTPLHLAAEKGYNEIVKLLINDPEYSLYRRNRYFYSPLELALKNGHKSTIDVFAEKGAKPWLIDKTQLFGRRPSSTVEAAIWDGDYQKIQEILEHEGKKVLFEEHKKYGDFLLQTSITYRQTEITKLFIEYGGNELILLRDDNQMTALHKAAFHGVLDLYQLILRTVGNDFLKHACGPFGTPLDCALYNSHIEIVEWTLNQPQLDLSFDELFLDQRDNWILMDLNPMIGGYFTRMKKLLGAQLAIP